MPQREKTYLLTCAPNEDSDQTAHSRSLISLRCPHEESLHPNAPSEDSDQTARMRSLI